MTTWTVNKERSFNCKNPIFIEGLPGIGNVGKVVVDILIDQLKAKRVAVFHSSSMPNSVFVNEHNRVQLPKIYLYHAQIKEQSFLFLTGDAQPSQEQASYELAFELLSQLKEYGVKRIITIGGVGMNDLPQDPKLYVTGNHASFIDEFKKLGANPNVYGVVGPIVGISGLLIGLAQKRKQQAVALLGETYGHPMYIGLKEARKILDLFNKKYSFSITLDELDSEIKELEEELSSQGAIESPEGISLAQSKKLSKKVKKYTNLNYIG
ncbi:MAG: PAC2 family protein [Nanobdellota archaeon]